MKRLALLAMVTMLAACGGSGDGKTGPVDDPPATVDADRVWQALVTAERTWRMKGSGTDGNAYDVRTLLKPRGAAPLAADNTEPAQLYEVVELTTTIEHGADTYLTSSYLLYLEPEHKQVSYIVSPTGAYCARPPSARAFTPPASSAQLNDSGLMFEGLAYALAGSGCDYPNAVLNGPALSLQWSYDSRNALPSFCLHLTSRVTTFMTRQSTCFEVAEMSRVGAQVHYVYAITRFEIQAKNF